MRRLALGVAVALGAVVALGAFALPSLLRARSELANGRDAMVAGRAALADGDLGGARAAFERARVAFLRSANATDDGAVRMLAAIPLLGRSVDVSVALGASGEQTAGAAAEVADALERFDVALGEAERGRISVEAVVALAERIDGVAPEVAEAADRVRDAPDTWLPAPVADARVEAEAQLDDLDATVAAARDVAAGMPWFLGADGPRTYFVGAENPAELRGSGGLIGAYALLRIDDGALDVTGFRPVQTLPLLDVEDVEAPSEEYARNYAEARADDGFWLNANMTPDFPSAAFALERSYEAATGTKLDGVLVADPFALQALVELEGPVDVPRLGTDVGAGEIVALLTNEAYAAFPDAATRKRALGDVAGAVLERALDGELGLDLATALSRVAGEGHLKVYVDHPEMQRGIVATGAGGAFAPVEGDFVAVVQNNAGANKVDFYQERSVRYEVWLGPGGAARAETSVWVHNGAPSSGLPTYVIGPGADLDTEPGDSLSYLDIHCVDCTAIGSEREGEPVEIGIGSELGTTFFQHELLVPSGEETDVTTSWSRPDAWQGDASGGTYRLTFAGQTTIRPTALDVVVHVPDGMRVTRTSPGAEVDGDTVTWRATAGRRVELEVAFEAPFPLRLLRDLFGSS